MLGKGDGGVFVVVVGLWCDGMEKGEREEGGP